MADKSCADNLFPFHWASLKGMNLCPPPPPEKLTRLFQSTALDKREYLVIIRDNFI